MSNHPLVLTGTNLPAHVLPGAVQLDDSPFPAARLGMIAAFAFFVLFLGWAAFARLDAAALGQGQISVSGNRQTIQHRDGGVVSALKVREGQHVRAGEVLIELAAAEVRSHERALTDSVLNLQAQKARLEAEVAGRAIVWPASFAELKGEDLAMARRAMALQQGQVGARRSALVATHDVIRQQQAQIAEQAGGYRAQLSAAERQRRSLQEQLEGTRELAEKGFVSKNQVRQIERSIAQFEGASAEYRSRDAAAREQIGQMRREAIQSDRKYVEESATVLRDTQFQLNELLPQLRAARDALERTVIRAPVSGRVVGLRVFTVGGVITGGQPLMDIVPDAASLVIRVNFAPGDIDGVVEGREAEVKFLSLHERGLPILLGHVRNVSADSLRDEASGQSFFTAEVVVPESQLDLLRRARGGESGLRPGVPVQVTVPLRKRTALQYMLEPLTETFSRSLHER
jgi:HlyD family secretion protein